MSGRIQVKLNGRRFEFDRVVALESCTFFQRWYSQSAAGRAGEEPSTTPPTEINGVKFSFSQAPQELRVAAAGDQKEEEEESSPAAPAPLMLDLFSFSGLPAAMPDYFGLIQVALRKGRIPAFNWEELNRAEQEGIAWLVNTFGIDKFSQFKTPTATEESYHKAMEEASKPPAVHTERKEGELPSLQQWLVEKIRKEVEARGGKIGAAAAAPAGVASAADSKDKPVDDGENDKEQKPSVRPQQQPQRDSDDDENVFLTRKGCFYCGIADHNTSECRFAPPKK